MFSAGGFVWPKGLHLLILCCGLEAKSTTGWKVSGGCGIVTPPVLSSGIAKIFNR